MCPLLPARNSQTESPIVYITTTSVLTHIFQIKNGENKENLPDLVSLVLSPLHLLVSALSLQLLHHLYLLQDSYYNTVCYDMYELHIYLYTPPADFVHSKIFFASPAAVHSYVLPM